jgi:hypothetical protein
VRACCFLFGSDFANLDEFTGKPVFFPSSALHEKHRVVRHDFYKTPQQAQRIFGANDANVARDHIRPEKENSRRSHNV